jgi:hypothetical protein
MVLKNRGLGGCRQLGNLDVTHSALSHVSVRLGNSDAMLIKSKVRVKSACCATRRAAWRYFCSLARDNE